jgi:glutamine synthetase
MVALEKFGIQAETSHHEVGIGQHEISFQYDNCLKTADSAITMRFILKAIAQINGLYATFMPKPLFGIAGSGMHVHQSLFNIHTNKNAFYDESDKYKLSQTAYNFIAGQLAHVKGMSAILSPTVNSYKRLVPGYEAPVYISWARTNRSALIRIPMISRGKTQACRCELRCPDPSCNIYLAFAVMLKAGIEGLKNNMLPKEPVEEDIYHLLPNQREEMEIEQLPYSLGQALIEFKKDELMPRALGKHIYDKYLEAKIKEWDDYRTQVTAWEIDRYLGIY